MTEDEHFDLMASGRRMQVDADLHQAPRRKIQEIPSSDRRAELRCSRGGHDPQIVGVVARGAFVTRWSEWEYPGPRNGIVYLVCDACNAKWAVSMADLRGRVAARGHRMAKLPIESVATYKGQDVV